MLIVVAPVLAFSIAVTLTRRLDRWSYAAGATMAVGVALLVYTRDGTPQHVENWRRGAEGERKTAKALEPLERGGWKIEHDLQREGRANIDHIATSPEGPVFLLETKNRKSCRPASARRRGAVSG